MKTTIYMIYANMDGTEGRGPSVPIGYFESEAQAYEFAKGKDVQGSDARVREYEAEVSNDGRNNRHYKTLTVYAPVQVVLTIPGWKTKDEALKLKKEALAKARKAGLTDEDLKALSN